MIEGSSVMSVHHCVSDAPIQFVQDRAYYVPHGTDGSLMIVSHSVCVAKNQNNQVIE